MYRTLLLLVLAALLAACAPEAPVTPTAAPQEGVSIASPPPDSVKLVTITFGVPDRVSPSLVQPAINAFTRANPDIRIERVSVDSGQPLVAVAQRVDTLFLTSAPDTTAVASGALRDLAPFVQADRPFQRSDFLPEALDSFQTSAGLVMLPEWLPVPLLHYNRVLWTKRGVPLPRVDWTWSDMMTAADQLAARNGDTVTTYGLLYADNGGAALLDELSAINIDPYTPADLLRLDRPEIRAALERVAARARSGAIYVQPVPTGPIDGDDPRFAALIRAQQVAMWSVGGVGDTPAATQGLDLGVVPFPGREVNGGNIVGYGMSQATAHPQEAWRWLSFLSRSPLPLPSPPDDPATLIPARQSLADQLGYWKQLDAASAEAVRAVLARPRALLPQGGWTEARSVQVNTALMRQLNPLLTGERAADEVLQAVQADLDQQALAAAQAAPIPTPAALPATVSPPPEAAVVRFGVEPGRERELAAAVQAFQQSNPAIAVQVVPVEARSLAEMAAGSDCFMWGAPPGPEDEGATLDLQPLLATASVGTADALLPALRDLFVVDGKLRGLPLAAQVPVLAYNTELFAAAKLAPPDATWSVADMARAAQALTRGSGEHAQYGFAAATRLSNDLRFFLDRLGARAAQGGDQTLAPTFTDETVAPAVRMYVDLLHESSPHRALGGYGPNQPRGDALSLIRAGRVAMWFSLDARGVPGGAPLDLPVAVASLPLGGAPLTADNFGVTGLYIAAHSTQSAACWQWLLALSASPPTEPGTIGASRARAPSARERAVGWDAVERAYRTALERPLGPAHASFLRTPDAQLDPFWFLRAVDRALQGANLEQELADAQLTTEQFLQCVRGGEAGSVCAKQVDPQYDGWKNTVTGGS